jgi:predicted transcriptional regulator
MTAGIESLHKILKDQTRRKIVLSINEKGSLSYTELMNAVAVSSTGTLNYHLKVLSDLLTKDETGQYMLTEKGKLASKLLLEFPERENQEQVKNKWVREFSHCCSGNSWVFLRRYLHLLLLPNDSTPAGQRGRNPA